ncbi:hypothetical protein DSL72_003859 [Monilinia vaccinii-corymbosi]|uniref:C2H2-type domain-containing protein n=1 Tax=Monilinia vaccinii-corymbosi TaxID=61207 RepID=A0A8A3NUG9_9HELO|nr:hypothetical protein DSL72_003859 [Monilinia vaccinii-corymbosi]
MTLYQASGIDYAAERILQFLNRTTHRDNPTKGKLPISYGPKDPQGYAALSHLFMFMLLDACFPWMPTTLLPRNRPLNLGDSHCGFHSRASFQGTTGFSLRHTEPAQGQYSGLSWNGKSEALQYSPRGSTSQGSNGFSDSSLYIPVAQMPSQRWSPDLTSGLESVEMTRFPSQESSRTVQSIPTSECAMPMGYFTNASQAPYQISSARSDASGRSASPSNSILYTPTAQFDLQSAFDAFPYQGDEIAGNDYQAQTASGFQQPPTLSLTTGGLDMFPSAHGLPTSMTAAPSSISSYLHSAQDSVLFDSSIMGSPDEWDAALLESSKPHTPVAEESWTLLPQMMSSTNSPLDYSPTEGPSPRYVKGLPDFVDSPPYKTGDRIIRKPMGPRASKVASDTNARRVSGSEMPEESLKSMGRSSLDADNSARDHALYHNVTTRSDGLYHCPWEGTSGCQHKPEKLKCNYDKFVDSHLKPYRCKIAACADNKFSSTACLLRHEREAHAMHGHGDKPFLCKYDGCERGVTGNGFPRRWNLYDHMKRVHNDPCTSRSAGGSPPPTEKPATGSKKRKQDALTEPSTLDKEAIKRVKTPPVVDQQPSLVEIYHQSEQRLQEAVKKLHDLKSASAMTNLRNASECIKIMAQTLQKVNQAAAPAMNRTFSHGSVD